MNNADIVGIILIVLGLLVTLISVYTEPILLLVAGALIAAGIVLIITGGIMCRNKNDVEPSETPVYADAVPKVFQETDEEVVGRTLEPPLIGVPL
jgi:hypothetical protein